MTLCFKYCAFRENGLCVKKNEILSKYGIQPSPMPFCHSQYPEFCSTHYLIEKYLGEERPKNNRLTE